MDLNLVRVFVAIHETRSLTAAAERLYVTQPAVSQSLARLRREFDDPLFRRVGRVMEPTALADGAYPELRAALAGIDRAVDAVHRFEPATAHGTMRIALSQLGEIGWFPAVLEAVRSQAPELRVEVVELADPAELPGWLARGTVDLAATPAAVPGGFASVRLKAQSYGVAMASGNPLAAAPLTLEAYRGAHHLEVLGDSGGGVLAAARRRAGLEIEPAVRVHQLATVPPALAAAPDLVATVPDTIAEGWASTWPLTVLPLPFDMDPVEVRLYRRGTTHQSAALEWMFQTVRRAVQGSSGAFSVIHGDRFAAG